MIPRNEQEERLHLQVVKEKLQAAFTHIDANVSQYERQLQEHKKYLWENKGETVTMRQSIDQVALTGEASLAKKNRLRKLMASPYFGRIDFMEEGQEQRMPVYIGVHSFFDEAANTNLIYDWRAPISSMFYDFELGAAYFQAPSGKISGQVLLKRQYRIRKAHLEFMLENSAHVHDEVLQKELSKSSDERMKNIVATIQRDQNAIIRNETSRVLIIQGVAGSGKTSIALHRIAFLLYRFKDSLTSKNILIISPNKVFADYISNVLPELGEEKIPEMGMDELATRLLEGKYKCQTFFQQVSLLLEKNEEAYSNRIRVKASFEFLHALDQYLTYIGNHYFQATDLRINQYAIPAWFILERFKAYHRLPLLTRFAQIALDIAENIKLHYRKQVTAMERKEIQKAVARMFKMTTLLDLYQDFYAWLGKPELFKWASRSTLEYADVYPLVYLKVRLEGTKAYDQVKHLLVDEMQDYTPVQYAVLARLFTGKKTILGDASQSVNPYSSCTAEEIRRIFPEADCVKLCKSYRSTSQITHFAQHICRNSDLVAIERPGQPPVITGLKDEKEEIAEIRRMMAAFKHSEHQSLGIICKTQTQADCLKEQVGDSSSMVHLLTAQSTRFAEGIILTTAHLAKGLEFDCVIVPFASAEHYKTPIDKSMLYIACTRAMHQLAITYAGEMTAFIDPLFS